MAETRRGAAQGSVRFASAPAKEEPPSVLHTILGGFIILCFCGGIVRGWFSDEEVDSIAPVRTPAVTATETGPASPTEPSPPQTPSKAASTPTAPWDRLLANGHPEDEISAQEAGLPESYIPDRGHDAYYDKRPRKRSVRRDMAAFLLRVRAQDSPLADGLGWQLQAIPVAWCSMVLPTRTPAQLAKQVAAANAKGRAFARSLSVAWKPPTGKAKQRVLTFAREEAARRFCPAQSRAPGRPQPGGVSAVARVPGGGESVDALDTALPVYASSAGVGADLFSNEHTIDAVDLRVAYMGILVGTARVDYRYWPFARSCSDIGTYEDLQSPHELKEYADRLRKSLVDRDKILAATTLACDSFELMELRFWC